MNQIFWQHLKSMLAISSLILLGACSSTPEQPAAKFMGLLEVHIQGIGEGGTATASARFVDPSSLGQTSRGATVKPINGTSAVDDVQFVRRQVSFSDDELNARRLVTGRFELINRSSTAFNNLTLYAVNIPGTTLGGTGIANMFDATGAAITDVNKARAFEPAHGTRPLDFSTVTDSNTADLQFFTPSEVNNPSNGIQQQAFAQSIIPNTATVLEYGFVARNLAQGRSIAARDTPTNCTIAACHGQITLAYNLPKITPRNLNPWAFNLYFVAADESVPMVSQSLEEQTADTAAGAVSTAAFNDVRVLAGSNLFDEKNLNQLCRVRTAVGPDAFLGRDPIPNSSGSLDVCFGANGRLRTATDTLNFIQDVAIQSDGKIVAVGTGSNGQDFLLVRYNPNGSLDVTTQEVLGMTRLAGKTKSPAKT